MPFGEFKFPRSKFIFLLIKVHFGKKLKKPWFCHRKKFQNFPVPVSSKYRNRHCWYFFFIFHFCCLLEDMQIWGRFGSGSTEQCGIRIRQKWSTTNLDRNHLSRISCGGGGVAVDIMLDTQLPAAAAATAAVTAAAAAAAATAAVGWRWLKFWRIWKICPKMFGTSSPSWTSNFPKVSSSGDSELLWYLLWNQCRAFWPEPNCKISLDLLTVAVLCLHSF